MDASRHRCTAAGINLTPVILKKRKKERKTKSTTDAKDAPLGQILSVMTAVHQLIHLSPLMG